MATDISNGKGGEISVTSTPQKIQIVPAIGSAGGHESARYCKVWNTGANIIFAVVNADATDQSTGKSFYVEANAIPIPVGEFFQFVSIGKPIKELVLACASGDTSTANYGAY